MMPNNLIVAVDILSNLLHENKIDFIVLNGLSLARLNSEPTSCMEDVIDFYVFSKDREKALTLLKEHVQISEDNSDSYRLFTFESILANCSIKRLFGVVKANNAIGTT